MIVLDTVWMIVNQDPKQGIIYGRPVRSSCDAWFNVIEDRVMGSGQTRQKLVAKGWRAKRVQVVLP